MFQRQSELNINNDQNACVCLCVCLRIVPDASKNVRARKLPKWRRKKNLKKQEEYRSVDSFSLILMFLFEFLCLISFVFFSPGKKQTKVYRSNGHRGEKEWKVELNKWAKKRKCWKSFCVVCDTIWYDTIQNPHQDTLSCFLNPFRFPWNAYFAGKVRVYAIRSSIWNGNSDLYWLI